MLEKFNLMLLPLLTNTSSGLTKYNLFDWIYNAESMDSTTAIIKMASVCYNLIFIVGGMFFGYKIAKSIYVYNSHDVTSLNRKQLFHEILEPIVGMCMLAVGWVTISIFVSIIFPGVNIGPNFMANIGGTMKEIVDLIKQNIMPIFSSAINLIGMGLTVYCIVRAAFSAYGMSHASNPKEAVEKKEEMVSNLISAAIAVCLTIVIKVFLEYIGLGGVFNTDSQNTFF